MLSKGLGEFISLQIINDTNCSPLLLNENCGAEFVHKMEKLPENMPDCKYGLSLDGDADRIIYFFQNDQGKVQIIDGDKMIALLAQGVSHIIREVFHIQDHLDFVSVNTQYSDFGLVDYLKKLDIDTKTTPTGVKFTHMESVKHDISIYFEANGHGTFMIKDSTLEQIRGRVDLSNEDNLLAWRILNYRNNLTGDAVFNFLQF